MMKRITISVILVLILLMSEACVTPILDTPPSPSPIPTTEKTPVSQYDEDLVTGIYQKVIPAVVEIHSLSTNSLTSSTDVSGQGSGFIFDDQGHLITNYHVVQGADELEIILHDDTCKVVLNYLYNYFACCFKI